MPQPKDHYDPFATDPDFKQQIIVREKLVREPSNGTFSKFRDAILLAIVTAVGWIIWTMNQRLTTIETLVKIIAKKSGIDIQ